MTSPLRTTSALLLAGSRTRLASAAAVTCGATAVSSLSLDPPSLLVCINRSASLHGPLAEAEVFGVNVLGLANRGVADRFANGHGADRFAQGQWEQWHGVPVLANAQSSFVCRRADSHVFGTHSIFIGQVEDVVVREDVEPLVYLDGRYGGAG